MDHSGSCVLESSVSSDMPPISGVPVASNPPPLPPRRNLPTQGYSQPYMNQMYRYGGYNSYPSAYGLYGGYSPYARRYGMGMQEEYDSRMMQVAEESCQALFGPLDSFVRSVSAISMVLDSTLQAMQFSFRTVVSAADSLSKLKSAAFELASGLSVFRLIRTFFSRVLSFLGIIKGNPAAEKEWAAAAAKVIQAGSKSQPQQSPWPAIIFFAIMMGSPYLMFKMFGQFPRDSSGPTSDWIPDAQNSTLVTAVYDFVATGPNELSMKRGDKLHMRMNSQSSGWVFVSDGSRSGYVPSNRLARTVRKVMPKNIIVKYPTNIGNVVNTPYNTYSTTNPVITLQSNPVVSSPAVVSTEIPLPAPLATESAPPNQEAAPSTSQPSPLMAEAPVLMSDAASATPEIVPSITEAAPLITDTAASITVAAPLITDAAPLIIDAAPLLSEASPLTSDVSSVSLNLPEELASAIPECSESIDDVSSSSVMISPVQVSSN